MTVKEAEERTAGTTTSMGSEDFYPEPSVWSTALRQTGSESIPGALSSE